MTAAPAKKRKPLRADCRVRPFYFDMFRFIPRFILILLPGIFLASCSPAATPTPFIPPTSQSRLIEPTFIINPTQNVAVAQSTPLPTIASTSALESCVNDLTYLEDLTVPDNSFVTYGATIDKQWLVQNSGTCDWNADFRFIHIGGADLGAPEEILLFPARAGTQATLQIFFIAPFSDGEFESAWQAFDPDGLAFGDPIYIRVNVVAP
jgi:hypothetical protein